MALLEKLDHPAIVKVKAHGESQGLPWFAMELVEGPTLAARLANGPLNVGEARAIFARLLDAVGHAHDHGGCSIASSQAGLTSGPAKRKNPASFDGGGVRR